jgi:phosphomannomutase
MVSISGVRGIVGEDFHPILVARWSAAFAASSPAGPIVVGRDSRESGELFARVAADTLRASGRAVWELGIVPTPTVQVAVESWHAAGGMILTASHNPAPWNAMKFVAADGSFLTPEAFAGLRADVEAGHSAYRPFPEWGATQDRGREALRVHGERVRKVLGVIPRERAPRILLDCVHGAGGVLIPSLLREIGAEVEVLHEAPTGRFPRDPEPTGPALTALAEEAGRRGVAFALAVDPDADRCALAIPGTPVVGEEWTLPLVAAHVLPRRRGPVVTNLSTSTRLEAVAAAAGCPVLRTPVGEAHVVAEMRRARAVLGGEGNGGVIDPEIHLGRDAAVAAAWLAVAHASVPGGLSALARSIPPRYVCKMKAHVPPADELAERIARLLGAPADTRDGLYWRFDDGFVHVRRSATEPVVRIVVEAASQDQAESRLEGVRESGGLDAETG